MRKPINSIQRETFIAVYAMWQALDFIKPHLKRMAGRTQSRSYQLLACAAGLMRRWIDLMLDTIPGESLKSIAGEMKVTTFEVRRRSAGKAPDECTVMSREDLSTLIQAAVENTCVLCLKDATGQKQCPLRRVLNEAPVEGFESAAMPCFGKGFDL